MLNITQIVKISIKQLRKLLEIKIVCTRPARGGDNSYLIK